MVLDEVDARRQYSPHAPCTPDVKFDIGGRLAQYGSGCTTAPVCIPSHTPALGQGRPSWPHCPRIWTLPLPPLRHRGPGPGACIVNIGEANAVNDVIAALTFPELAKREQT